MSDTDQQTPAQASGEAGNVPAEPQGQQPAQGAEQVYLTRAEAEAMNQKTLDQARSYADKGRVRVEKAVQDVTAAVATMRSLGQEVTPAQEKALKDEATRKAITEPESNPADAMPAQAGQPQIPIDPEILTIQQEAGIELYDGDPEIAMIDRTKGQRNFYKSIEAAAAAKKQRLASQPPTNSPAPRLPVPGATSTGLPEQLSAREAWQRVVHKT